MSELHFDPAIETPAVEVDEAASLDLKAKLAYFGAAAIVLAEVTPANESARLAIGAAAESVASNPSITTAAVAGATLAIEAGAAAATASLMGSEGGQKIVGWVSDKAKKLGIGKDGKQTGVVGDLIIGGTAGSAVAVFAKQVQDPSRTVSENIRFGVVNSAGVATILSPAIYGVSRVGETYGWGTVGVGALAVGGVGAAINKLKKSPKAATETTELLYEAAEPRYDLSAEELAAAESELVDIVRERLGDKVAAVWIKHDNPLANAIRTHEAEKFPEIPELMEKHEESSVFLAVVDARRSAAPGRIARATRINIANAARDTNGESQLANLATVDGIVESGQISYEEVEAYFNDQGFDISSASSIETNFRIGERARRSKGVPLSQLAYLSAIRYVTRNVDFEQQKPVIVAHSNAATDKSLALFGPIHQPFAGRPDLQTPSINGTIDDKYKPVIYPYEGPIKSILKKTKRLVLPEIEL